MNSLRNIDGPGTCRTTIDDYLSKLSWLAMIYINYAHHGELCGAALAQGEASPSIAPIIIESGG